MRRRRETTAGTARYRMSVLVAFVVASPAVAGNPLQIDGHPFYGADPSGIVAEDGRMFLFPTTDNVDWEKRFGWSCYASTDLNDWNNLIYYTGSSPAGPFEFKGEFFKKMVEPTEEGVDDVFD